MRVIQLFYGTLYDDGVGNTVQVIDAHLKAIGYPAEIMNTMLTAEMLRLGYFKEDDIIFYHLSVRMDPFIRFVNCRKILVFHNITYPDLLVGYSLDNLRIDCAAGMYELNSTSDVFSEAIVFSAFSKETLVNRGWKESDIYTLASTVSPDILNVVPDQKIIDRYQDGHTNILFTGRIFPNKKQEDIINAFAEYKKRYNSGARLFLVGAVKSVEYYAYLKHLREKLNIEDSVIFTEFVQWKEYLAYYHIAHLYLCMSAHEGFCRPLLEAMYLKVPILAVAETAVPDTLGGGGVLIGNRSPEYVAGEMHKIISDKVLWEQCVQKGLGRYREVSGENGDMKWRSTLKELIAMKKNSSHKIPVPAPGILWRQPDRELQIPDSLRKENGSQVVLYGLGAKGMELVRLLEKKDVMDVVCICDRKAESIQFDHNRYTVCLPEDAVRDYADKKYVITLLDKVLAVRIAGWLVQKGIMPENIFLYDAMERKILG